MSFETQQEGRLQYLTSDCLHTPHCFSTRLGGVSQGVCESLNLGIHRGDSREICLKNYEILGAAVGFRPEDTVFCHQVHSNVVKRVGRSDRGSGFDDSLRRDCDGLVTNEPGVALTVFSADCTPILLYDPAVRAVGAVHAGWRGTAASIAARAVETMAREFGSNPEDIRAAIGPCIGPCCFETHADVKDAMVQAFGQDCMSAIAPSRTADKFHVDLKALNAMVLRSAGVREIDVCGDCTACQPARFWSHRKMGEARGVQAAVILLKD